MKSRTAVTRPCGFRDSKHAAFRDTKPATPARPYTPRASSLALSVRSQVKEGSLRPKCP